VTGVMVLLKGGRGLLLMGVIGQVVSCSCCYAQGSAGAPYV
jgi:hypothetical protein